MPTPEGASSRRWPALPLPGRRVWSMSMLACISQLDLDEMHVAPIDEIGRARVAEARGRSLLALEACAIEHRAPSVWRGSGLVWLWHGLLRLSARLCTSICQASGRRRGRSTTRGGRRRATTGSTGRGTPCRPSRRAVARAARWAERATAWRPVRREAAGRHRAPRRF